MQPNLLYGKDYVVVPPRVWKAFVNWYGRSIDYPRKVVIYPQVELSLRIASQLINLQQASKQTQLNEQQILKCLEQLIVKDDTAGTVRELEVDEVFVKCGMIKDDGKIPIDQNTLKNGAFSRKATVLYVKNKLAVFFGNR